MFRGKGRQGTSGNVERALYPAEQTFVIQVARQEPPPFVPHLGRVENVVTGKSARFSNQEEMWAFVRAQLGAPGPSPASPGSPQSSKHTRGSNHAK